MSRRLIINVDGRRAAALRPGGACDVPVDARQLSLVAQMDWAKSKPVVFVVPGSGVVEVTVDYPLSVQSVIDTVFRPSQSIRVTVASAPVER